MQNGRNGVSKQMAFIVLVIALANFLILNILRPGGLMAYILPTVCWSLLTVVVLKVCGLSRIRSWFDKRSTIAAMMVAICYIFVIADIGLVIGFGNSPYSFTTLGITINIILVVSTLLGMELSRAALVKSFGGKRPFLAIGLVSILYTFIGISTAKLLSLNSPLDFAKFLGVGLLPAIAENLLATYLALIGGPVASLAYRAPLTAFWWFCPILPNLSWGIEALVGVMAPTIGFFAVNQFVSPLSLKRAGIPTEARGFSRTKKSSLRSWMVVSVLCVLVVWSTTGLLGIQTTTIISGSMGPTIEVGDMAIVQQVSADSIRQGDIIQFWNEEPVIHRVVEVVQEGNAKSFITKGDANNSPDPVPVTSQQLMGKVVLTIPKLGWATLAVKNFVSSVWSFISANATLVMVAIASGISVFCLVRLRKNHRRWSSFRRINFARQKIIALMGGVLVLTAMSGLAYSCWSESVYINASVNIGTSSDPIGDYKVLVPSGYDESNAEPRSYLSTDSRTLVITCDNVFEGWYAWVGLLTHNDGTLPMEVKDPIIQFTPNINGISVQTYFYGPYNNGDFVGVWARGIDELPVEPWGGPPLPVDPSQHAVIWMKLYSPADFNNVQVSITVVDELAI